jgi:hypothetical protein
MVSLILTATVTTILIASALFMALWMAGAFYFDAGSGSRLAGWLSVGWSLVAIAGLIFWRPVWAPWATICALFIATNYWWLKLQPQQERNWDPNFACPARVSLAGDRIVIENVRNTSYRTLSDCSVVYETRNYRLSGLSGVDALILYWGSTWMSHPMFVFDFGPDGRVCISVEVRYRRGQKYDFLRSFYRQQELMYVVSDERDAILRRTKFSVGHDVYMYRLNTDPLEMRQFFFEYTVSINRLAQRPQWYHALTANCTTGIYTQGRARLDWDWRMLFNGSLDRMLYDRGRLDRSLPFAELKRQSRVNEAANRASAENFGDEIRANLPGYRQKESITVRTRQE